MHVVCFVKNEDFSVAEKASRLLLFIYFLSLPASECAVNEPVCVLIVRSFYFVLCAVHAFHRIVPHPNAVDYVSRN